jgi:hypothetical protein
LPAVFSVFVVIVGAIGVMAAVSGSCVITVCVCGLMVIFCPSDLTAMGAAPSKGFKIPWKIAQNIKTIAAVGTVVCVLMAFSELKNWWHPRVPTCPERIVAWKFASSSDGSIYVHHPNLERELSRFIGNSGNEYIVVNGPKGAGKSTLVDHVISGFPFGVIKIKMITSVGAFYSKFSRAVCGSINTLYAEDIEFLQGILEEATMLGRLKTNLTDWVPTIVVEVDKATPHVSVHQIAREMKLLCVDGKRVCRGIIVLSDALAASALPKDPRVKMMWVDDFTVSQANKYLDLLQFLASSHNHTVQETEGCVINNNQTIRNDIFRIVGTRPIDLIRLVAETRYDQSLIYPYLTARLLECKGDLQELFDSEGSPSGAEFQHLAKKMVTSKTRSTPRTSMAGFSDLKQVASILQEHHAMLFHPTTQTYRFFSNCFASAAVDWFTENVYATSGQANVGEV